MIRSPLKKIICSTFCLSLSTAAALATDYVVTVEGDTSPFTQGNPGDLRYTLNQINIDSASAPGTHTLSFNLADPTIPLTNMLPIINLTNTNTLTLDGSNTLGGSGPIILDGGSSTNGFLVRQGTVSFQNITIQNTVAAGGAGADGLEVGGGGGGLGAGGALFIYDAAVSLSNVSFINNSAVGGAGGQGQYGGGGGMLGGVGGTGDVAEGGGGGLGGNGGTSDGGVGAGSGGGGIGPGGDGGNQVSDPNAGNGGGYGASAGASSTEGTGGLYAGGGASGSDSGVSSGASPVFGGGAGSDKGGLSGGNGGFGGGGGGASQIFGSGGTGGFGGGGGGSVGASGGNGGFGGGGGSGGASGNNGGFGGGGGAGGVAGTGGVGAGLGGAIFLASAGSGSLTISGPFSITGSSVTQGIGVNNNGAAAASDIFVMTGSSLTFSPPIGETITITGSIGDDSDSTLPPGSSYTPGSSGGSSLTQAGAGTLILSGTNTYAGTTYVNEGILSIESFSNIGATTALTLQGGTLATTGDFSTGSIPINLGAGSGTFSPSMGTELMIPGTLSGSGNLIKTGSGTLMLTGVSSYVGKTYVNEGTLVVNGDITSSPDPIVQLGASLLGTGRVGDTDVYGIIQGGDPVGTLSVSGDLILRENSTVRTVLTPSEFSFVDVSGIITINPGTTYELDIGSGTYGPASLVLLSAESISGEFSQIDITGASYLTPLNMQLVYSGGEFILELTLPMKTSIASLAIGENALKVAETLDSTPELSEIIDTLSPFTTPQSMSYALNKLHPAHLKGLAISQENNAVRIRQSISQRIMSEPRLTPCASPAVTNISRTTLWMSGLGDTLVQKNVTNHSGPLTGYRTNTGGAVTGIDAMFAKYFCAGALGAYSHSHLRFQEGKGKGDLSTGYAGFYVSGIADVFYVNASILGSWSKYSTQRQIEYATVNLVAKNSHGGRQLLSHFDTGLRLTYLGITFRAFDSFDYITQTEKGYAEENAAQWNLSVKKNNNILLRNECGLGLSKSLCFSRSGWRFFSKISWIREARIRGNSFDVNFTSAGPSFTIEGYFPDRSLIAPGLGLTGSMLEDALVFDLYYNGEFKGNYSSNSWGGQIRYSF